ncbi:MAG: translation elongation factor Ts [Eubacteriales bacterium]
MSFTAADVKELRESTGVGMMDCKKALTEAGGDKEKAIDWLREKGLAAQSKKAGKVTAEGVSFAMATEDGVGVILEVNSQTDFVSKNEVFQGFVKDVATVVATANPSDVEALQQATYPGTDRTVNDVLADKVLSIGENINIRRFSRYTDGVSVGYVHMGGKIAVLINMAVEGISDMTSVNELGKDLAMQIAAMNPTYLDESEVDAETAEKEKKILLAVMKEEKGNEGKTEDILNKMLTGRFNKYLKDICLTAQPYVKATEKNTTVASHVAAVGKAAGGTIKINSFVRFATGEGIEKEESDFAAEVASFL